jgi:hypothetical protein
VQEVIPKRYSSRRGPGLELRLDPLLHNVQGPESPCNEAVLDLVESRRNPRALLEDTDRRSDSAQLLL